MARFCGEVGFGDSVETAPGVWVDIITEKTYFGDVVRNTRRLQAGQEVNSTISIGNSISIVSDEDANNRFHAIRYVKWGGTRWIVTDITVEGVRLILSLGGVYNGPTPAPVAP